MNIIFRCIKSINIYKCVVTLIVYFYIFFDAKRKSPVCINTNCRCFKFNIQLTVEFLYEVYLYTYELCKCII